MTHYDTLISDHDLSLAYLIAQWPTCISCATWSQPSRFSICHILARSLGPTPTHSPIVFLFSTLLVMFLKVNSRKMPRVMNASVQQDKPAPGFVLLETFSDGKYSNSRLSVVDLLAKCINSENTQYARRHVYGFYIIVYCRLNDKIHFIYNIKWPFDLFWAFKKDTVCWILMCVSAAKHTNIKKPPSPSSLWLSQITGDLSAVINLRQLPCLFVFALISHTVETIKTCLLYCVTDCFLSFCWENQLDQQIISMSLRFFNYLAAPVKIFYSEIIVLSCARTWPQPPDLSVKGTITRLKPKCFYLSNTCRFYLLSSFRVCHRFLKTVQLCEALSFHHRHRHICLSAAVTLCHTITKTEVNLNSTATLVGLNNKVLLKQLQPPHRMLKYLQWPASSSSSTQWAVITQTTWTLNYSRRVKQIPNCWIEK